MKFLNVSSGFIWDEAFAAVVTWMSCGNQMSCASELDILGVRDIFQSVLRLSVVRLLCFEAGSAEGLIDFGRWLC
jgi:hypothetical protein